MSETKAPRKRAGRSGIVWFIALWCLGVLAALALTLPLHLLVMWAR
jgi:hypothetical protein